MNNKSKEECSSEADKMQKRHSVEAKAAETINQRPLPYDNGSASSDDDNDDDDESMNDSTRNANLKSPGQARSGGDAELARLRREKRLAMNRASARARRNRKKALMETLEGQVAELAKRNQSLQMVNESLNNKVQSLETELAMTRATIAALQNQSQQRQPLHQQLNTGNNQMALHAAAQHQELSSEDAFRRMLQERTAMPLIPGSSGPNHLPNAMTSAASRLLEDAVALQEGSSRGNNNNTLESIQHALSEAVRRDMAAAAAAAAASNARVFNPHLLGSTFGPASAAASRATSTGAATTTTPHQALLAASPSALAFGSQQMINNTVSPDSCSFLESVIMV
jgi:DNA repair exonuclease SbcCD ATPase subunit